MRAIFYGVLKTGSGKKVSDGVQNYSFEFRNHHLQLNHYRNYSAIEKIGAMHFTKRPASANFDDIG